MRLSQDRLLHARSRAISVNSPRVIGLVGPTAAGKSDAALFLARHLMAEIVCVDSVTAYRGMTIGSAKPSLQEQAEIPHHLLDICDPDHMLTVAEFVQYGHSAIHDIYSRGKTAIVVGGSGLYMNGLLYGYEFRDTSQVVASQQAELESLSIEALQSRLDKEYPGVLNESDRHNSRRVIQVLLYGPPAKTDLSKPIYQTWLLGLDKPDDVLKASISKRTDMMLQSGFVGEVEGLMGKYGSGIASLRSVGYKQVVEYLEGRLHQELPEAINFATWQLVRKQRTWFRKNKTIEWVSNPEAMLTTLSKSGYNN